MRFPTCKGTAPVAAAVSAALLAAISPQAVAASGIDEAGQRLEEAKADYAAAVSRYEDAVAERDRAAAEAEEARAEVEADIGPAREAARALYRGSRDRLSSIVELVVGADGFSDALARIDALNRMYESNAAVLAKAREDAAALEDAEAAAERAVADADAEKEELDAKLDAAIAGYEEAEAEEEARAAEEAAARTAPARSGGSAASGAAPKSSGSLSSEVTVSVGEFMDLGVIYANGYRYTYYTDADTGTSATAYDIPGRHVEGGMVCDADGYICVASNDYPAGTAVPTPIGRPGKVYDCGCASGTIDLYFA